SNTPPTPATYTLSLHDALPICPQVAAKTAEQITETGPSSALLRPRRGEKADREDRLQYRRRKLADRRPGPELGEYDQSVIHEQRSEEHTSELQSRGHLVCRLLL